MKFMNAAVSRQQRSSRQRRGDSSATKLSIGCALWAPVAIKALPLRLYNNLLSVTTLPLCSWRFICVSTALMLLSWRLNYAHDFCRCATADYSLALKTFYSLILTLYSRCHPSKAEPGWITFSGMARRLLSHSLDRRRGIPTPAPQTSNP